MPRLFRKGLGKEQPLRVISVPVLKISLMRGKKHWLCEGKCRTLL
ncbi:MAG: hypothetical protein ACTSUE_03845 [Promethearchaeota archaeon]